MSKSELRMQRNGRSKYAQKLGLERQKSTEKKTDLRSARFTRIAGVPVHRSRSAHGRCEEEAAGSGTGRRRGAAWRRRGGAGPRSRRGGGVAHGGAVEVAGEARRRSSGSARPDPDRIRDGYSKP